MVKNLPSSTGDAGLNPGEGTKIPHATGQLSLSATITEPKCSKVHASQLERSLHAPTKTWHSQINKLIS